MHRKPSDSELESFPSLDWSDIAPRLTPEVRASLEKILETQNGADLSLEESYALANAEGDDLLGLLVAANLLRAELAGNIVTYVVNRNINFTNICFVGMQILRLQPRPARGGHLFPLSGRYGSEGCRSLATRRHRSLHTGRSAARSSQVPLSRHSPRRKECRTAHAHSRLLADGNRLRRRTHRHAAGGLSFHAARQWTRHAARHRRRNSRRRDPPHPLGQQAFDRAMDRGHPHRTPLRHPHRRQR